MRLNLGLTEDEKEDRNAKWRSWFAWHPVRIGYKDYRWLEVVWRRKKRGIGAAWEYCIIEGGNHEGKNSTNGHPQ